MWDGVLHLLGEIRKCQQAGATAAALVMAYVCIDTMASLALPVDRDRNERADFISWANTYLRAHEDQAYQYRGIDVYGARCAVLHGFAAQADYHQRTPDAMIFGYHDGGRHIFDPTVHPRMVMIGTVSFLNDVTHAVQAFLDACRGDAELRARVAPRLLQVLAVFPMPAPQGQAAGGADHG